LTRDRASQWVREPATVAFAIAFVAFLAVALAQGEKPFYYDSGTYWSLSQSFVRDGHFSLLNFENNGLRGYALPLAYYLLQKVSRVFTDNDAQMVMTFNAAVFGLIGAALAPGLARISWPESEWGVGRRLLLSAILALFWRGFLSYPLSDFPALAAALLALVAVASVDSPGWILTAGVSTGLALNFRPAYALLVPVLAALIGWGWLERQRSGKPRSKRRVSLCLALFAAPLVLVSLPQSISNHEHLGSYTPLPGGSGLVDLQYTEGLRLQRYDTYVGGTIVNARMAYVDPSTEGILGELEDGAVHGSWDYAKLVLEHPLTMAGVFLRHVVNGLDQRYPTVYVEHLQDATNRIPRFLGFLLVFLALVRVAWPAARRRLGPARWRYPAALLLASSTTVASAVETRFLLPVFVLASVVLLAPGGWPNLLGAPGGGLRRYRTAAVLAAAAIAYYAVVWTIVSGATDHLVLAPG
jgi:hypothetical protein